MRCINKSCNADEIENDDNFCYKCGHWTTKGFSYIKNEKNVDSILNGEAIKKDNRLIMILLIFGLTFILFIVMCSFRGNDLFKPFFYLKKQINKYVYGYNTTIIKTNNIYNKKIANNLEEAKQLITEDLEGQSWKCSYEVETSVIEYSLQEKFLIPKVNFCEISHKEAMKIEEVIEKMYYLFPNIKGALTNISIANTNTNSEYIARFQPMFEFVNPNEDISSYNKVNKTQILLNSYYFLNHELLEKPISSVVGDDWYVKDATWETTIAHELGHYISFFIFLKQNDLNDIILVTKENENKINNIVSEFEKGEFSGMLVQEALNNYNSKYDSNLDINSFALSISRYAGTTNKNGILIADETIAEAIHDYFLHGEGCSKSSYEIVEIIKSRL